MVASGEVLDYTQRLLSKYFARNRNVYRTLPNIYDETILQKIVKGFWPFTVFSKKFHYRVTGFERFLNMPL